MARKFLVFSCIVLLISIVYFIYTSYQLPKLQTETENQQETLEKLMDPSVGRVSRSSASQSSKPESSNPEPVAGEQEAFETVLKELEASGEEVKVASEAETSETENRETRISPELEALFVGVKQFIARERVIDNEARPFLDEHFILKQRQMAILLKDLVKAQGEESKRLREEFKRINEQMKTLSDIIAPFGEQKRQLWDEFEEKYGITLEEFMESHEKDYKSWKSLQ